MSDLRHRIDDLNGEIERIERERLKALESAARLQDGFARRVHLWFARLYANLAEWARRIRAEELENDQ